MNSLIHNKMIVDLPLEIIYYILSYVLAVVPKQSFELRLICSQFNVALGDGYVWDQYLASRTRCTIRDKMGLVETCGKKSMQVCVTLVNKDLSDNVTISRMVAFKISPMVHVWILCACYAAGKLNVAPHRMKFYYGGKCIVSRDVMHKRVIDLVDGNYKEILMMEALRV